MDVEKYIDKFLFLISDPRNIAPDEFSEYYSIGKQKYNSKNLNNIEIENHFINLRKFKIAEDWKGFISLKAELFLLLSCFEKQVKKDKKNALDYFILRAKNPNLKTQLFITEQILSREEYFNLLGVYTVFYNNLSSVIIKNFKHQLLIEQDVKEEITKKTNIEDEVKYKIGLMYAMGKMQKYIKNGRIHPDWSAPKIEKDINIPKSREYILGTLNDYTKSSNNHTKNVFNSIKHREAILKHCKENNIKVCESFIRRHNLAQLENR